MQTADADSSLTDASTDADAKSLLVVDDDRLIVATISQRLRSAGYRVLNAFDGPTALTLCASDEPDLAILDYLMPVMSGAELARELTRTRPIPIVFLSAYSDETIVSDAIGTGALTYVVKPIDTEQLLPIVRTALRRGSEISALHHQNERLQTQLDREQDVSAAVGILMATLNISRRDAFERIRHEARSKRTKLDEIAREFLRSFDESNRLLKNLSTPMPTRKSSEDKSS